MPAVTVDRRRRQALIEQLRRQGIGDERVLAAMEAVPRDVFVNKSFDDQAYANIALPIDCGQTISQPLVVADMTEKLLVGPRMVVLEIGTGSGYQAAVLARLCRRVYTIERYQTLLKQAEARFAALDIHNITTRVGDGLKGWREQAPFDRILVTAGAERLPRELLAQLKDGGIMVLPLTNEVGDQYIVRIRRDGDEMHTEWLEPVRFVPLLPGTVREGGPE